jgi:hypothetical protein
LLIFGARIAIGIDHQVAAPLAIVVNGDLVVRGIEGGEVAIADVINAGPARAIEIRL